MAWYDWVADTAEGGLGWAFGKNEYNKSQSSMNDINKGFSDQIKAYKEQTELSQKELDKVRGAQEVEKRRINEKQIRALRNNYRPSGFLNNGNTLSENSQLPNKLGTA